MIAHIEGTITEKYGNFLIVDVAGVGYEMMVPTPDFEAVTVGERRKFFTYHAVRENSEELYGFSALAAKKIFELLISVQGVGPKAAIAILSLAEAEEVRNAIANADATFVSKASGVSLSITAILLILIFGIEIYFIFKYNSYIFNKRVGAV